MKKSITKKVNDKRPTLTPACHFQSLTLPLVAAQKQIGTAEPTNRGKNTSVPLYLVFF